MSKNNNLTIEAALAQTGGNQSAAARLLGIPRPTLVSRLRDAGAVRVGRNQYTRGAVSASTASPDETKALRKQVVELTAALRVARELYTSVATAEPKPFRPLRRAKSAKTRLGEKHLVIPDPQVKEGVPIDHLEWAGEYAADKRPDLIALLMDWWDMPSLSSYDRGKLQFEGRRYRVDIEAGKIAMERFLKPIRRVKGWAPRIVATLGNHENRVVRAVEENPILKDTIGPQDFQLEAMGIEVYRFLEPVVVAGVKYCHYFPRSASGAVSQTKRGAPTARAQLIREGGSCVAGHQQGLDVACLPLRGQLQWGIIAGSFYQHEEEYLSPQGTAYWRGVPMLHEVHDGNINPMFVSLEYLQSKYGS